MSWDTPSELESAVARIGKAIKLREDYESPPYLGETVTVDIAALEVLLQWIECADVDAKTIVDLEDAIKDLQEDVDHLKDQLREAQ